MVKVISYTLWNNIMNRHSKPQLRLLGGGGLQLSEQSFVFQKLGLRGLYTKVCGIFS